jgi:hypothetical protein
MSKLPSEVEAFQLALERFVAVREVCIGLKALSEYTPETYSLPGEFGDLPHALLRRDGGGREDETWVPAEFELSRDSAGWLTLEFLAWWVRDLSRSGHAVQLRPMSLPPKAFEVQLGETLKFIIDQFVVCPVDNRPALVMVQERADSLNSSIDIYAEVLGDLIRRQEE